jgi:hypothetical protein
MGEGGGMVFFCFLKNPLEALVYFSKAFEDILVGFLLFNSAAMISYTTCPSLGTLRRIRVLHRDDVQYLP